ncbi:UNVERIFIED_CONTAM: hypothetical protein RMT77_009405 [Armadillidium vulgare]
MVFLKCLQLLLIAGLESVFGGLIMYRSLKSNNDSKMKIDNNGDYIPLKTNDLPNFVFLLPSYPTYENNHLSNYYHNFKTQGSTNQFANQNEEQMLYTPMHETNNGNIGNLNKMSEYELVSHFIVDTPCLPNYVRDQNGECRMSFEKFLETLEANDNEINYEEHLEPETTEVHIGTAAPKITATSLSNEIFPTKLPLSTTSGTTSPTKTTVEATIEPTTE